MNSTTAKPTTPRVLAFEYNDPSGESLDWLEARGVEVTRGKAMWAKGFQRYSESEIIQAARGYVGVMGASGAHFTRAVLDALPDLRFISKLGVGVDSIDVAAATEKGVLITNTPVDSQAYLVSEHAIALMLALKKRLLDWTPSFMAHGGWRGDIFAGSLAGSTVGIIGLGRIGQGVARRLAGWDVRILAFDPYLNGVVQGVTMCNFQELLRDSDIVTLHAVPTSENQKMINGGAFAQMKAGALLINTGRASLVDYAALREALRSGRLGGAGLDVFETEPPDPRDPLFAIPNVVVTPHSATWVEEGMKNVSWRAVKNMWAMLSGEGEASLVN
jgi:D-3-phosphoglycerate dehydrogenase / 2-oxoglutarate reductase